MSQLDPTWKVVNIPSFNGGVNTSQLSDLIQENQTTVMRNLSMSEGRIRTDQGFEAYGGNFNKFGTIRQCMIYETSAGTKISTVISDYTVGKLVSVSTGEGSEGELVQTPDWQLVTTDEPALRNFSDHVLTDDVSTGAESFTVDTGGSETFDTAWTLTDNVIVGIRLDSGAEHIATITGVAEGGGKYTVSLNSGFPGPVGVTASDGNAVVSAVTLNGRVEDHVSTASVEWGEGLADVVPWIIFTNGIDVPLYFNGTYVKTIPNLQDGAHSSVICKYVGIYKGTAILANCIVDGDNKVNTIIWSDIGNATVWSSGNAGENALLEEGDPITGLLPLGEDMMIYGGESIIRMRYVGSTNYLFSFTSALTSITVGGINVGQSVGAVSGNAIHNMGDAHIFMGIGGVYLYRGSYSAERISDPVYQEWFGSGGIFDATKMDRAFALYNQDRKELSFYSPSTDQHPTQALVLLLDTLSSSTYQQQGVTFRERKYPQRISGGGEVSTQETQLWSNFTLDIWKEAISTSVLDPPGTPIPIIPPEKLIDQSLRWNSTLLGTFGTLPILGAYGNVGESRDGSFLLYNQESHTGPNPEWGNWQLAIRPIAGSSPAIYPGFNLIETDPPSVIEGTLVNGQFISGIVGHKASTNLFYVHFPVEYNLVGDYYFDWNDPISIINGSTTANSWGVYAINGKTTMELVAPGEPGSDISWELRTKDFSGMEKDIRTDFIDLGIQGTEVGVSFSRDSGLTWTSVGNVTADSTSIRSRLHSQGVSNSVTVRIQGTGPAEIGPTVMRWREEDRYRLT